MDLRGRSVGLGLLPEGNFRFLLCDDPGCYDVRLPLELHGGLELGALLQQLALQLLQLHAPVCVCVCVCVCVRVSVSESE